MFTSSEAIAGSKKLHDCEIKLSKPSNCDSPSKLRAKSAKLMENYVPRPGLAQSRYKNLTLGALSLFHSFQLRTFRLLIGINFKQCILLSTMS